MANPRVVQKSLAGQDDLLFGEGQVVQKRGNGTYPITKNRVIYPINDVSELVGLDPEQFPKARLYKDGVTTDYLHNPSTLVYDVVGDINDLSQVYIFDTVAAYKASTIVFPDGKTIHLNDRDADFLVITGTGTANTFNIISSTSTGQSVSLTVTDKTVSTKALGSINAITDSAVLSFAANSTDWTKIIVENYSPAGGEAYCDRSDVEFDFNRQALNMTGVAHPVLVLGQKANGDVSDSSVINISTNNVVSFGDKTAGSRIVRYRKASTCTQRNWRAAGCYTPFDGDGTDATYLSLACEFYSMDLRGNTVGFDDAAGSFQGSTFFGGRIEQNDLEGVVTNTTNLHFSGTVIEGNGVTDLARHEIKVGGGGSLNFTDVYGEISEASTAPSYILVVDTSTKRVNMVNSDLYGNNNITPRRIVTGTNWVVGSLSVLGGNVYGFDGYVVRNGAAGNWIAHLAAWSEAPLEDASTQINGALYFQSDRTLGVIAEKAKFSGRVQTENLLITEAASGSFVKQINRFMGTIVTSGVGVWHTVASISDLEGGAGTSLVLELIFGARQGDFRWKDAITINGTTVVSKIANVYGNWSTNTYRINAGNLEVDNIPASSRTYSVSILTQKTSTA